MKANIIAIAEAHARIAVERAKQTGGEESPSILNSTMTQIIDLLWTAATDIDLGEVERDYHQAFWQAYNKERQKMQAGDGETLMFYLIENISGGDVAAIEKTATSECQLMAVQSIPVENLSNADLLLFSNKTCANLFQVFAETYDAAREKLNAVLSQE